MAVFNCIKVVDEKNALLIKVLHAKQVKHNVIIEVKHNVIIVATSLAIQQLIIVNFKHNFRLN